MPKLSGIEAAQMIKDKLPNTKILILTIHESEAFVYEMIHAGANGYVLKNAEKKEILSAVRAVAAGEPFFSPSVSKLLIEGVIKRTKAKPLIGSRLSFPLSRRETQILGYIAEGLNSHEIAERLNIGFSTVNSHRNNLMRKLDIHDTAGLVRYTIRHKITSTYQ